MKRHREMAGWQRAHGPAFDTVNEAVFDASTSEVFAAVRDESAGR